MRRLRQKIISWVCALTMTASLTGTAFADTEEETLPTEEPPYMEASAEEAAVAPETTEPVTADMTEPDGVPAGPAQEETPVKDTEGTTAAKSTEETDDSVNGDEPETGDVETPAQTEEQTAAEDTAASEGAEDTDDGVNGFEPETDEIETPAQASEETGTEDTDAELSADQESAAVAEITGEEFSVQGTDGGETGDQNVSVPTMTIGGSEVNLGTGGSGEGWNYDAEDGSLLLINCDNGDDVVVSDGGVTIKAAGLNHLTNLSVDGDITLIGTGVLLIDEIELGEGSSFFLQSNSELYGENGGGVAVFVRQDDGTYLLQNGSVPGILDEEYVIEGITLVIPEGSSLQISSIGAAMDEETGDVTYYHPGMPSGVPSDGSCVKVESAGQLTIGQDAKLIVQANAAVQMEHLASEILGNCFITPLLNLVDNAALELYGSIEGSGGMSIGGDSSLTGNGRAEGSEITVGAPEAINDADVTFSSGSMVLNGEGMLDRLQIEDSTVYVTDNGLVIDELVSSGNDTLVLPTGAQLHDISVEDQLTLMGRSRFTGYDESQIITIDGEVEGDVLLSSGFYDLSGAETESASFSGASPTVVAEGQEGVEGISPYFLLDPGSLPQQTEDHQVSVIAAIIQERPNSDNTISFTLKQEVELSENDSTVVLIQDGETVLLDLDKIEDIADSITGDDTLTTTVVELVYLDEDGQVHTEFYRKNGMYNQPDNLSGTVDAEGLVQVRIYRYGWLEKPDGSGTDSTTSTTFTGTGVLGNGGAGDVIGGSSTPILSNNPDPDPDPDPKPKPTGETAAVQRIEVWAEPAADSQGVYTLRASVNGTELATLVGRREVRMDYRPAAGTSANSLYVVFRNTDGTLSAVKARYDAVEGKLIFTVGRLGRFVVVSMPYNGVEFSEGFYEALGKLDEVKKLG